MKICMTSQTNVTLDQVKRVELPYLNRNFKLNFIKFNEFKIIMQNLYNAKDNVFLLAQMKE